MWGFEVNMLGLDFTKIRIPFVVLLFSMQSGLSFPTVPGYTLERMLRELYQQGEDSMCNWATTQRRSLLFLDLFLLLLWRMYICSIWAGEPANLREPHGVCVKLLCSSCGHYLLRPSSTCSSGKYKRWKASAQTRTTGFIGCSRYRTSWSDSKFTHRIIHGFVEQQKTDMNGFQAVFRLSWQLEFDQIFIQGLSRSTACLPPWTLGIKYGAFEQNANDPSVEMSVVRFLMDKIFNISQ